MGSLTTFRLTATHARNPTSTRPTRPPNPKNSHSHAPSQPRPSRNRNQIPCARAILLKAKVRDPGHVAHQLSDPAWQHKKRAHKNGKSHNLIRRCGHQGTQGAQPRVCGTPRVPPQQPERLASIRKVAAGIQHRAPLPGAFKRNIGRGRSKQSGR